MSRRPNSPLFELRSAPDGSVVPRRCRRRHFWSGSIYRAIRNYVPTFTGSLAPGQWRPTPVVCASSDVAALDCGGPPRRSTIEQHVLTHLSAGSKGAFHCDTSLCSQLSSAETLAPRLSTCMNCFSFLLHSFFIRRAINIDSKTPYRLSRNESGNTESGEC